MDEMGTLHRQSAKYFNSACKLPLRAYPISKKSCTCTCFGAFILRTGIYMYISSVNPDDDKVKLGTDNGVNFDKTEDGGHDQSSR